MTDASTSEYPRPDFVRPDLTWVSLNGAWDFLFDDEDVGLKSSWQLLGLPRQVKLEKHSTTHYDKRQITVPFVFQTPASGLNERGVHEVIWYERQIQDIRTTSGREKKNRLILRFGAVDYQAIVWLNGSLVGTHRGGHVPFDLDLTDAIELTTHAKDETYRLSIRVFDSATDLTQPRGKQYWAAEPESIFYTPSSGIWQSVWLESVPFARLADSSHGTVLRSDNIETGELQCKVSVVGNQVYEKYRVTIEGSIGGVFVAKNTADVSDSAIASLSLPLRLSESQVKQLPNSILDSKPLDSKSCWRDKLALWSPEFPALYDLTISLHSEAGDLLDLVNTTTGMRSLEWTKGDGTFRLNGRRCFQALVLDQGYWPETGITPPSAAALREDIEISKKMGFNGCRKHQKVEDPLFLYWADRLGYLVWGEMANAYRFDDQYVSRFDQEWIESVRRDINHPCVVTWTPINESWGYPSLGESIEQRNHIRSLYYTTKTLDPTRPINDNCGWEHVCTDLTTFHDYSDGPQLSDTCKSIEGILQPKSNRIIFVAPHSDRVKRDEGASHRTGAPVLCTEFGGVNIAPAAGESKNSKDWGYTTASDPEDLLKRIERLVLGVVEGGHCCGFVYTQLTDIEQEVNGLYSFDRRQKLDAGKVKAVMDAAQKIYYDKFSGDD